MSLNKIIVFLFMLMFHLDAIINPYGPTVISDCVKCITNIIGNEVNKTSLIIFANTKNASTSVLRIRNELLKNINREMKFTVEIMSPTREVEVCDNDNFGVLHVDYSGQPLADCFVIIIDNYKDFSFLANKLITSLSWNPFAKFIVLLFNFVKPDNINIEYIENILSCLFKYNAINVIIALPQKQNYRTEIIYSWKPYDPPKYCGHFNETAKGRLIVENKCEHGILKHNKTVFQYKIPHDMSGCIIKIFALQRQPYISDNQDDANIEKILINRIVKRYNMIAKYELIDAFRGERSNGKWNGGLNKLVSKKGHLLAGGIFPDFDVHEDFECSTTYLADAYAWVVPKAPKLPPWVALLIIFQAFVWYSAITGFFVCALSWKMIGQLCSDSPYNSLFSHCFLNTWICIFGFVTYKRPIKGSLRIFFVFLNLYSMLFVTAYQTKLFDTLTNPSYEYQLETVEELISSGLKFGGFEELHDLFGTSSDPLDKDIGEKWTGVNNITAALIDVVVHRNFSLLCSRLQLAHYTSILPDLSDLHGNYKYYVFKGNAFSVPIEFVGLKGFPFMHVFSETITLFKQSGLNEALRYNFSTLNERRRAKLLRDQSENINRFTPLSVSHLQGGFLALALGYIGGSVILIIEIVITSNYVKRLICKVTRK